MSRAGFLGRDFFETHFLHCAQALVGCELVWNGCAGRIVETEAYAVIGDAACHTFARAGARAFVEKNPPGTAYVYLNYGIHWLLNVLVKGGVEQGIILIRALEPTLGIPLMETRRRTTVRRALCSGPGKLAQALGIVGSDHERSLCLESGIGFRGRTGPVQVVSDTRIGISRATDFPWRFLEKESPYVSIQPGGVRLGTASRGKQKSQAG
jgi:DNA-3-methyladenine glycosylase